MDRKQVILSAINNPPPGQADAIVLALEAAGYVIVPKAELDELKSAAGYTHQ